VLFAVFLALLALSTDFKQRMLYLIPCLVLFYGTIVLFSLEYDKASIHAWKKKEKSLIEETYSKYVTNYHKKK
jgi:hypothetical protein